jgi:phosphoribosyl 1,2-cyclic phosphate phosphodiesterase
MQLTFLGTGAAGGVPLWGCECEICSLARIDVSFIRRPNCALIEAGEVSLLLDAGVMDVGERFPPGTLSAILVTHFHVDHVQGLFHLRWGQGELEVYAPHDAEGCADLYKSPGPLKFKHLSKFEPFNVGEVEITPVPLVHSKPTLGYCIEHAGARLAYLSDCRELPPATAIFLDEWKPHSICLDCTYPPGMEEPHNHFDLLEALALSQRYPDSEISLMHIGHRLDEWLMKHQDSLPERVTMARDNETRVIVGMP